MYELERRALDDPFLADALEGFACAPAEQGANLAELSDRLHQRTKNKARKTIPWMPLSIAASIIVVLGAGIWFFTNRSAPETKHVIVQNIATEKKEVPIASNTTIAADTLATEKNPAVTQTQVSKMKTENAVMAKPNSSIQHQRTELTEAPPVNSDLSVAKADVAPAAASKPPSVDNIDKGYEYRYVSPKRDSVAANDMLVRDMTKKKAGSTVAKPGGLPSTPTLLQSRVDGVSVNPDENYTVTGIVVGDDGSPLTGATVRVQGRNFGAVTDVNGKFSLQDVPKGQTLSVNYIGYSGKKVKAAQDSMRISLNAVNSSLSEVVVTKQAENNTQTAHPRDGWKSFNDYLDKNAQLPDGKTGKEKISFTVAPDGTLSQFKVIKSLGDDADKKAISLISAGPAWVGNTEGKAKEVTVTVKFH
jgi:hypothetical protein